MHYYVRVRRKPPKNEGAISADYLVLMALHTYTTAPTAHAGDHDAAGNNEEQHLLTAQRGRKQHWKKIHIRIVYFVLYQTPEDTANTRE